MRLTVIGTGYVGLVAGAGFSDFGNDVTCVDVDAGKIARLERGEVPIYEPGLDTLIAKNVKAGRLRFSTDVASAIQRAEAVFIGVGTPSADDGSADLSAVFAVAETIGKNLPEGFTVVATKSTVPVGTADKVRTILQREVSRREGRREFGVASNPEFLKEGAALEDFTKPDRVVIGCETEGARKVMEELYSPYVRTGKPILFMDPPSAEMTKYAANAMLATRISFMNEMARICEVVGADVNHVRKGIGTDERIGFPFLFAGVGYGGSCFPKDVRALVSTAKEHGYQPHIVPAVEKVNEEQKHLLFAKIQKHFGGNLKGKHFAVWGLAFKPKTDDMREAPSLVLIDALLKAGATVCAFDPEAMKETKRIVGDKIRYSDSALGACQGADGLVLVTEWSEFRHVDTAELKSKMKGNVLFDGRNIWDGARVREQGFTYYGIGVR